MMPSSSPFISLLLLISIPALFLIAPRFLPPKPLPSISADADDLALFRRATLSSGSLRRLPRPKIAFLFLANSDLIFAPLWQKFFLGHESLFNLYLHLDPTSNLTSPLSPLFINRLVPSKPTHRASPSLISAERRLIAAALLDDPANSFFALLSQSCIPLHSFPFIYRALLHSKRKSFIEILDQEPSLGDRYVARGDNVMLPEVPFEKFRVGSQFFVLSRKHAVMVVKDRRLWKKFRMPCLEAMECCCYPEEHYFPTLLSMMDPKGCTGYTLTRVNWTGSFDGHPRTYSSVEISPGLVKELRRSNSSRYEYLFARKFANDTLVPLLGIADAVIFRD